MADNLASDLREKELCLNFKFRVFEYGYSKMTLDKANLRELLISVFIQCKRDLEEQFNLNKKQKQGIPSANKIDYNSLAQNFFHLTDFSAVQEQKTLNDSQNPKQDEQKTSNV